MDVYAFWFGEFNRKQHNIFFPNEKIKSNLCLEFNSIYKKHFTCFLFISVNIHNEGINIYAQ